MTSKYHVCWSENLLDLETYVNAYLNDGYVLHGNLTIDGARYIQVVVKLV